MSDASEFTLTLDRAGGYRFDTGFDDPELPVLRLDEPRPLGTNTGPNASRLIGAAVGNCLSASLLFCLEKAKVPVVDLRTHVTGTVRRRERGRWRLSEIAVTIMLAVEPSDSDRITRCLELFEDYCVVTSSLRRGLRIDVRVTDTNGHELYDGSQPETATEET